MQISSRLRYYGFTGVLLVLAFFVLHLRDGAEVSKRGIPHESGQKPLPDAFGPPEAQSGFGMDPDFQTPPSPSPADLSNPSGPRTGPVISSHPGRIQPDIQSIGRAFLAGQTRAHIRLSDQLSFDIEVESFEQPGPRVSSLSATIPEDKNSRIILTQVGEANSGSLQLPATNRYYEIRNGSIPSSIIIDSIDMETLDGLLPEPRKPPESEPLAIESKTQTE